MQSQQQEASSNPHTPHRQSEVGTQQYVGFPRQTGHSEEVISQLRGKILVATSGRGCCCEDTKTKTSGGEVRASRMTVSQLLKPFPAERFESNRGKLANN